MRMILFLVASLGVFAILIALVVQKETILREGRTVYLEQAPLDPRSLIQGDYMVVRYQIEQSVRRSPDWEEASKGYLVLVPDESGVGRFVRIHKGEPLTGDEFRLRFRRRKNRLRIGAESFFFQEGHAERYEGSKFGELKVSAAGECILVDLVDESFEPMAEKPLPPRPELRMVDPPQPIEPARTPDER